MSDSAIPDPSAGPSENIGADLSADPDKSNRTNLVRLLRVAYPHERFPDGPYERTADTILAQCDESLWHRIVLTEGLTTLDARASATAGSSFRDLDDAAALQLLQDIADAEFFRFVRAVTVVTLYNDSEVYKLLGYEGPSFEQGGYIGRGFDDLDWLPTPRIEEYDGPDRLVEVAPHDEAAGRPAAARS